MLKSLSPPAKAAAGSRRPAFILLSSGFILLSSKSIAEVSEPLRYHHTIPPQKLKPCLFCRRARADVADVRKYLIPWYCGAQRQLSGLTVIIIGQEETTTTGDPSTATLLRGAKPQQSGKGEWKSGEAVMSHDA